MNNKEEIKKFKKEVENLKPGDGVVLDDKTKYEYGADLHTDTPLIDPATGKTVTIRTFTFKMNPDPKIRGNFPIDKQILFNSHARQIKTILWGDGLIPLEDLSPHVIIKKKEQRYLIIVPCGARMGVSFLDKPRSLNEVITKTPSK